VGDGKSAAYLGGVAGTAATRSVTARFVGGERGLGVWWGGGGLLWGRRRMVRMWFCRACAVMAGRLFCESSAKCRARCAAPSARMAQAVGQMQGAASSSAKAALCRSGAVEGLCGGWECLFDKVGLMRQDYVNE